MGRDYLLQESEFIPSDTIIHGDDLSVYERFQPASHLACVGILFVKQTYILDITCKEHCILTSNIPWVGVRGTVSVEINVRSAENAELCKVPSFKPAVCQNTALRGMVQNKALPGVGQNTALPGVGQNTALPGVGLNTALP